MFDWDDSNIDHIARHNVRPEEVEKALADPRWIGTAACDSDNERRWAILGATDDRRVLFVVCTNRRGKVRVVAARDATPAQRRRYWR